MVCGGKSTAEPWGLLENEQGWKENDRCSAAQTCRAPSAKDGEEEKVQEEVTGTAKDVDRLLYRGDKIPSDLSPRREVAETGVWPGRDASGRIRKGEFHVGLLGWAKIPPTIWARQAVFRKSDRSWLIVLLLTLTNGSTKILLCVGIGNKFIPKRFDSLYCALIVSS